MKPYYRLCILLGLFVVAVHSGPISRQADNDDALIQSYLKKFYNLTEQTGPHSKGRTNHMSEKIAEMQKFFGLTVTGTVDQETLQVMKKPRCGVPEVYISTRCQNLTMFLLSFPDHSDNSPFSGQGDFVAHAFFPSPGLGGDIHFDDEETFSFSSSHGYNLFLVTAHEVGHALGLHHTTDPGALMYKFYSSRNAEKFILPQHDVDAIHALYGPNPDKPVDPEKPEPTRPVTPNACDSNLVLDAVTMLRGEMLFFKKGLFWRTQPFSNQIEQHLIQSFWPGAPENIDAAYENPSDDMVYLFKGQKVWALFGYDIVQGYPKTLQSIGLPAKLKRITAALYDHDTGKALLFSGKHYYSYNAIKKKMDKDSPKRVDDLFPGMTTKVTAAFQYRGFTYLYSGSHMYEFDTGARKLIRVLKNNYFLPC
uniref:Matrix metalloproteinase-14 n=1 Tax=Astyanax mexicanus TaxID=7994 RepID=A0A8B9LJH8_ASTMX